MKKEILAVFLLVNLMKIVFIVSILTACGSTDSAGTNQAKDEPKDEIASVESPDEIQAEKITALSVTDLPACTSENLKQLVYHVTEKKFYTCENSGWENIEISNSVVNNSTVNEVSSLVWRDEITGKAWFMRTMNNSYAGCGDSALPSGFEATFATPSLADIQQALSNGLFEGFNVKIWYSANNLIYSESPTDLKFTTSGNVYALNLCVVVE